MAALDDFSLRRIDGAPVRLKDFHGKVRLIVNVASKCGLTPQYAEMEAFYRRNKARGLEILAFPANDFLGQEPGTDDDIASFCATTYDVTFPVFSKISVTGADKHPLYATLTRARPDAVSAGPMRERLEQFGIPVSPPGEILWNFEKFLIARDGEIVERFAPDVSVDDPRLIAAVEDELDKEA
jgi:glutathione peroxidase